MQVYDISGKIEGKETSTLLMDYEQIKFIYNHYSPRFSLFIIVSMYLSFVNIFKKNQITLLSFAGLLYDLTYNVFQSSCGVVCYGDVFPYFLF